MPELAATNIIVLNIQSIYISHLKSKDAQVLDDMEKRIFQLVVYKNEFQIDSLIYLSIHTVNL